MTAPTDGPIAGATASLVAWLTDATGADVRTQPPTDDGPDGLVIWPLELVTERELRTARHREPLRLTVRHLVAGDVSLLDKALVAATAAGRPTVTPAALPAPLWQALGCTPRIALLADMPALIERPTPDIPIVTEELRLDVATKDPVNSTKEA